MGSTKAPPLPPQARLRTTLTSRHGAEGTSWVLAVSGEADIATIAELRDELALLGAARGRGHLVVDLSGLDFCDVACASLLLTARRTLPCSVGGASGAVRRVLDLVDALRLPRRTDGRPSAPAGPSTGVSPRPVEDSRRR